MPQPIALEKTVIEQMTVSLEPARNVLSSMVLLTHEDTSGLHEWVTKTRAQFSKDEIFRHKLVILGLFYAVAPELGWSSFPAYLDHLSKINPEALREKLLNSYAQVKSEMFCAQDKEVAEVQWEEVLSSVDRYIDFLESSFGKENVDHEIESEAYRYVMDPPAMKKLIVDHLRWIWNVHLAEEWNRVQPMLQASVNAFQTTDLNMMDRMDAVRFVTGQDLDEAKWKLLATARNVIFIPNAHIGPYVTKVCFANTLAVVFGARVPENSDVRIPDLDRAELVVRLSAIADETRLRILQMVVENGEIRSQDIMDAMSLSQPSVSRYLTQLTATGYLQERRSDGAKVYILNRERIKKTLKAVSAFLLGS